ncbi:hypothetical protein [Ferruginibacter sp.]
MKKLLVIICILFSINAAAQNVGIGETNPAESKLKVKTADSAVLLIQNTATALNTKTGLFYKSDNNYSGSIATIQTAPSFYRMGLFTFGGAAASGLKERVSILDDGNVGIGTTNPTTKLEVAGTLKIADGTQGADKVLTSDAAGNASWQSIGSKAGYKYCKQITAAGSGNFTVPAGVTEVMVELWGAGSGGVISTNTVSIAAPAYYFGGTSGGYAATTQTVIPGNILSYTIGSGSTDNLYTVTISDGGSTTITFAAGNLVALGGKGHLATSLTAGQPQSGTSTLTNFYTLYGNPGGFPTFKAEQTSSTDFWKIRYSGDGGRAVGMVNPPVQRGAVYYFLNGPYQYDHSENANIDNYPGSGGASDEDGNSGGNGMILIWYN